jgi:hypothetical protein
MGRSVTLGSVTLGRAARSGAALLYLCLAVCRPLQVQAQTLDLPLLGVLDVNLYSSIAFSEIGGVVYTDGIRDVRNQLLRLTLSPPKAEGLIDIHRFYGSFQDQLLVAIMGPGGRPQPYLVEPGTLKRRSLPGWRISIDWALVDAGEGVFFSARAGTSGRYQPYRFDTGSGTVRFLDAVGVPVSLSGDRLHLLIQDPDSGRITFWNLFEEKPTGSAPSLAPPGQVRFVDNGYALLPPEDPNRPWSIVDVEGKEALQLSLRCGRFKPHSLWLESGGEWGVAGYMTRLNPRAAVVDARPLWERLKAAGLVFVPTTGTLNDSRVRIREHPSLKAKTLGYLEKGERVRVWERSGYRQPIEGMMAPWYRIETDDGKVGWSYGYFIDLD